MKAKLLKRLRKKAKECTWVQYRNGFYRAYKKDGKNISYTFGARQLKAVLRDLYKYRRELVLDWIDDMREERINRGLRDL